MSAGGVFIDATGSLRSRVADFKTLLDELTDRLEASTHDLKQARLDLASEQDQRRRHQQDASTLRDKLHSHEGRRSFVLILIDADADGYMFQDRFLKKGEEGGREAADEMLVKIKQYLQKISLDVEDIDVMVRAYANVKGLAKACVDSGKLKSGVDLHLFTAGFTQRGKLFDFIDVGPGKERADNKIRDSLSFFIGNGQCKHVILGCCHDTGYAPFLEQFAADKGVRERITLLEGSKIEPKIAALGFKNIVKFETVFVDLQTLRTKIPILLSDVPVNGSSPPPKHNDLWIQQASKKLSPVLRNSEGKRVDKKLEVDVSLVNALRRGNLCAWYYLRGECTGCSRVHTVPPLEGRMYDACWFLSREGLCNKIRKGKACDDDRCIYGH